MPNGNEQDRAVAEAQAVRVHVVALARSGVRMHDLDRVWVEPTVAVAPGATLWGGAVLRGTTRIATGAEVQTGAVLVDTTVAEGAIVKPYSVCEGASIGAGAAVGPMAHLRPGTVLEADVKVGNFVEVKKTTLGRRSRVGHLTYLGDAEVGEDTNIGAGTITCNFDGTGKHPTRIGSRAFIGSNTALVAPIAIGDGAIVGAGSTLTHDVPADALAVARAEEKVRPGLAPRIHARNRRRGEERGGG